MSESEAETQLSSVVYVVDDDSQACRAVGELARSYGHEARLFESANDFLQSVDDSRPGCVILDIRLPSMDGTEVHQRLLQRGIALPVIVLTAYADTPLTVRSLRNGAITVLDKPYRDDELWGYVQEGLQRSEREHHRRNHLASLEGRLKKLAPSDRSVLQLMLRGYKNRSIAKKLDVSLRTVENRRRRVFDVMLADSVAQLTRMVVEYEHSLLPINDGQDAWLSLPYERVA
jgi:two-component system response regulator FixJ